MVKQFMLLAALPLLMFVAGCKQSGAGSEFGSGAGNEIRLRPGEKYVITLEENPTTGYNWQIFLCDLRVFNILENKFIPPESKNGMVGVPGMRRVVIEGTAPGKGELEMIYVRPWEKDVEPVQRANYTIYVLPN